MAGRDHEEKRQFQRLQLGSQLQFRRAGDSTLFKGQSLDLSATGVRFYVQRPMRPVKISMKYL